ncbi:MAG: hypothetical protein K6A40_13075 [Solobacterium sp.]|nr:hypothetical protein [Solobacterium sp.]
MEDYAIIEMFWQRDRQAMAETEKKYSEFCSYLTDRILADQKESEKCLAMTWLSAWESIPPARPSNLRIMLGRMTREAALKMYGSRPAERRGVGEIAQCLKEIRDITEPGEFTGDEDAVREKIRSFVNALAGEQRRLFIRRYWYMSDLREISREKGMTEDRMNEILSSLRLKLKEILGDDCRGMRKTRLLTLMNVVSDEYIEDALPRRLSPGSFRIRHIWSMTGAFGFLILISLLFRFMIPDRIREQTKEEGFIPVMSEMEAEEKTGVEITIPPGWANCTERIYSVHEDVLQTECFNSDRTVIITVRKKKGRGNISGDISEYKAQRMMTADGRDLTLKGNRNIYPLILFEENGYSYSILFQPAVSEEEIPDLIGKIY